MSKQNWTKGQINFVLNKHKRGYSRYEIAKMYNEHYSEKRTSDSIKHCIDNNYVELDPPKVLVFDLETAPMELYGWGLYDQNTAVSMIIEDAFVLSWSAKWLGDPDDKVMYADQRHKKGKSLRNDKQLIKKLLKLMNEADIVLGQNSDSFDVLVLNERIAHHKLEVLDHLEKIDTKKLAKRHLRLPSYGLEYMSKRFNKRHIKSSHPEFHGFSLHKACLDGNIAAFKSMEKYNAKDVLATEELFTDTLSKFSKTKVVKRAMLAHNKKKNKK